MTRINIGGETYKVRQREVDGKKQEIYYKDGQAYIKNGDGQLETINKFDDGLFKKASYTTKGFEKQLMENYANSLNSRYEEGERPELSGVIDQHDFEKNDSIVGYKGRFSLGSGGTVNGVVFRDEKTNTNKVKSEQNAETGANVSTVYALKDDSSDFFIESRTITLPDGSSIHKAYNYETGDYEITRTQTDS